MVIAPAVDASNRPNAFGLAVYCHLVSHVLRMGRRNNGGDT